MRIVFRKIFIAILFVLMSAVFRSPHLFAFAPGDIHYDGKIDIADAIVSLKILTDNVPNRTYLQGDVNSNNQIDLVDTLYVLQWIAGLRGPILNAGPPNRNAKTNQLLTFQITAKVPPEKTLTFSATNLPDGAVFDPESGTFSWLPLYAQSGVYNVTFIATDSDNMTDSQTIEITINYVVPQWSYHYYPVAVGNWWDYKDSETGLTERVSVTGTKILTSDIAYIYEYENGDQDYIKSDAFGIRLFGGLTSGPEGPIDAVYSPYLRIIEAGVEPGTTKTKNTSYSFLMFGTLYHVDLTCETTFLAVEDVSIENSLLIECFKFSFELTQYIEETGQTVVTGPYYHWYKRDFGIVKIVSPDRTQTIVGANVGGNEFNY